MGKMTNISASVLSNIISEANKTPSIHHLCVNGCGLMTTVIVSSLLLMDVCLTWGFSLSAVRKGQWAGMSDRLDVQRKRLEHRWQLISLYPPSQRNPTIHSVSLSSSLVTVRTEAENGADDGFIWSAPLLALRLRSVLLLKTATEKFSLWLSCCLSHSLRSVDPRPTH